MKLLHPAAIAALFLAAAASPAVAQERWSGAWGFANVGERNEAAPTTPAGTFRYRISVSHTGDAVGLTFSNVEGAIPLDIGRVSIAVAAGASGEAFDPNTVRTVTFSRTNAITVAPGRAVVSDPVPIRVANGQDLIVSLYLRSPSRPFGTIPGVPTWFTPNDDVTASRGSKWKPAQVRPFLSLAAVRNPASDCTVVVFGDSITDGYGSGSPKVRGWPARLLARWQAQPPAKRCGIVNMGIGGNRILKDGTGTAAVDRFWRDVASVPGATDVILLEGINDIGGSSDIAPLAAADLIAGYRQIIGRAHALGMRIFGATLTPALGSGYMSDSKETIRQQANRFIREGGEFDGVIDFDAAVRDPADPSRILPLFDPGDHLHPNDAGYQAMADAIDLTRLQRSRSTATRRR